MMESKHVNIYFPLQLGMGTQYSSGQLHGGRVLPEQWAKNGSSGNFGFPDAMEKMAWPSLLSRISILDADVMTRVEAIILQS